MNKSELYVGMPVWVYQPYSKSQPWAAGTVVKIGRTIVDVALGDSRITPRFYIESQAGHGDFGYTTRFRTQEQLDLESRAKEARAVMADHGLEFRHGMGSDVKKVALAIDLAEWLEAR